MAWGASDCAQRLESLQTRVAPPLACRHDAAEAVFGPAFAGIS